MAKVKIVQKLEQDEPKKHSVKFKAREGEKASNMIITGAYLMREAAKKAGVKDLDSVDEITITVEFDAKSSKHDDEEDAS